MVEKKLVGEDNKQFYLPSHISFSSCYKIFLFLNELVLRSRHFARRKVSNFARVERITCSTSSCSIYTNNFTDCVLHILLLLKVNTIPDFLIRGKPYHLRKCGE